MIFDDVCCLCGEHVISTAVLVRPEYLIHFDTCDTCLVPCLRLV